MNPKPFSFKITVAASAIDTMGHVNNVVYLEWVQEAGKRAWETQAAVYFEEAIQNPEQLQQQELAWVALDHHITYHAPAFEGDIVEVSTYVKMFKGAKSERHTTITRLQDAKVVATAITNWCLLKMPEGRPIRVPKEITALF